MQDIKAFERTVAVLDALADKTRLALLLKLLEGKTSFTDLIHAFRLNPNSLSRHLKTLENAGLVSNVWEGGRSYHSFYLLTDNSKELMNVLGITREMLSKR